MATFQTKAIGSSLALALCLCLVPVVSPRSAEVRMMMGAGVGASCGKWLEGRKTGQHHSMAQWTAGYISGAAIWGTFVGDPLGATDADGVFYWLDNYCKLNPTSRFTDAVDAFIVDEDIKAINRPSTDRR